MKRVIRSSAVTMNHGLKLPSPGFLGVLILLLARFLTPHAVAAPLTFADPQPQRYEFTARASEVDPRARPHPEIDYVFEKDGKPADVEHASVDTRVPPQGRLVIWLMGHNAPLFERVNSYGLHAIQVHYANGWFGRFGTNPPPGDDQFLGKIRLEAATGEDFSDAVNLSKPDGMMERAWQLVKWLAQKNPPGRWEYFLTDDGTALRWERVIMAGASHGSTTAARFAKHQRVDRVVMFCGPRDQYETWQALPSATPTNRFFGFSHVLDDGWKGNHYCRSWELLGLQQFGPVVNVDQTAPPYGNTRRLITTADVKHDAKRAHGSVTPGGAAVKDASGRFIHEAVWRYLFTQPVETVGSPVPHDPACQLDLRPASKTVGENRYAEAIARATQVIATEPNNPRGYLARARLHEADRQPAKAVADYDQVLKLDPRMAEAWQQRGSEHFKLGHITEAIADFDRFLALVPQQEAHHWQRGIAYFYAGRFAEGRKQFELHQTVNSDDVENAVWHFLCVAREAGVEKARAALIPIRGDPRVPMMDVHALFAGKASAEAVLQAAVAGELSAAQRNRQLFYAHLYLGLYFEATSDEARASEHITKAAGQYRTDDYMGDVARVHLQLRSQKKVFPTGNRAK